MDIRQIDSWLSPDLSRVIGRFPLAIAFAIAATAVALIQTNALFPLSEEDGVRLFAGLEVGFILALAGRLFVESRPEMPRLGLVVCYILPFIAPPLFFVQTSDWVALPAVPVAAVMWLSVSGFTRIGTGAERADIEDRFWWLNQRAVISGGIAIAASVLVFLGLLAVDYSLDLLFGIEFTDLMMRSVMPIVYFLLAPVYWLAVLPRLDAYDRETLEKPDFLTQAIGFLGQFVLTPLLIIYSLILVAYAVQIVITQTLPVGVLGWLVLAFVVTGAANWLLLHPAFVRDRLLARVFRRSWYWAVVLPLVLFALAVFVRVDAYGLTPERMLLIAGGIWAAVLTLFYLLRGGRGDIRLIPALAGLAFLVLGFGPFNLLAMPYTDQAQRFEAALAAAQQQGGPGWTPELAKQAKGALDYLEWDETHTELLSDILVRHGLEVKRDAVEKTDIAALIGLPADTAGSSAVSMMLEWPDNEVVSVAGTPDFLGDVSVFSGTVTVRPGFTLGLEGPMLVISQEEADDIRSEIDLAAWLDSQQYKDALSDPAIDFALGTRKFRFVASFVEARRPAPEAPAEISSLSGWLFSDRPE